MPRLRELYRRPDAAVLVAALLTVGQTFWWHNHDAHRSLFSFGMTVLWAVALTVVMAWSVRSKRREAGARPRRRRLREPLHRRDTGAAGVRSEPFPP